MDSIETESYDVGTAKSYTFFWFVTGCSLLSAFIPAMVKLASHIMTRESDMETNLRRQVCDLKAELGGISMVDEFAKYAKIQRKINKASGELSHQAQIRSSFSFKFQLAVSGILYFISSITFLYITWNYYYEPVVIFPNKWLYPMGPILSIPSGIEGAIGLCPWLLITGTVGRLAVAFII